MKCRAVCQCMRQMVFIGPIEGSLIEVPQTETADGRLPQRHNEKRLQLRADI